MNKKQLTGVLLLSTALNSVGALSITSANVSGFQDAATSDLGGGVLAMLVVDTRGDGFQSVKEGDFVTGSTLGTDTFVDDDDDLIVSIFDSVEAFSVGVIQGGGRESIDFVHAGKDFIVYWFPGLSVANGDSGSTAGVSYGSARSADWTLAVENGISVNGTIVSVAGPADNFVQPVPEPSSTALLGLGAFGLILRRRRA